MSNNNPHVLASGAVEFLPQGHTTCGICGQFFMLCQCEGLTPHTNYIFEKLPPPAVSSTRSQLIQRWCSLVAMSMSMGAFAAQSWYRDNSATLWSALEARTAMLREMMEDYVVVMKTDPTLPALALAVTGGDASIREQSRNRQLTVVSSEARAAMDIFLSGDWSCLTFVGSVLLQNAFQASDPSKYRLDDPQLATIFENGVAVLNGILGRGFDTQGYPLAMEMNREPVGTTASLKSAAERLNAMSHA